MNIRQLRVFKVVADCESITEASKLLYMSQPAVSSTIIELEEVLGFDVFDRLSRRIYLNENGKLFLAKVNHLLDVYDDLEKSTKNLEEESIIKIGSSITLAMSLLIHVIKDFKDQHPKSKLEVVVKNAEDIERMVLMNELDFGLVEGNLEHDGFEDLILSSYELAIVAHPEHPLSKKKEIEIHDLLDCDLLLREKGSAIRDCFDREINSKGMTLLPTWTSINSQVLMDATLKNLGITVLPRVLVHHYLKSNDLVELNLKDSDLKNEMRIIYNKGKYQSVLVQKLIDGLRTYNLE